jgi:single-strand DNA-binding protein
MRVIVVGRLTQRQYEANDGSKRSSYEIQAEEVAPSLLRATATVTKAGQSNGNASTGGYGQQTQSSGYGRQQPQSDPWATNGQEPPF